MNDVDVERLAARVAGNVRSAVAVRDEVLERLIVALLAGGHVLVEDLPGVGKTALARAVAISTGCTFSRVQCTADMLPSDLTGVNVLNQLAGRFDFRPGPIFANVVLVDEINRASAKTQSGLLECMQERSVTIDGETRLLAPPFVVLATQNPLEFEGTYPLPVAQLDRFMLRVSLGYPSAAGEAAMLAMQARGDRVESLEPVSGIDELLAAQRVVSEVRPSERLLSYLVGVVTATRDDDRVELGASPRAALALLRAAMALAAMGGRDFVLPDDVQALAPAVLAHRLLLVPGAADRERERIVRDAVERVPAL